MCSLSRTLREIMRHILAFCAVACHLDGQLVLAELPVQPMTGLVLCDGDRFAYLDGGLVRLMCRLPTGPGWEDG